MVLSHFNVYQWLGSNGIATMMQLGLQMGDTLWLFNIAMENDLFIDGLPIKNGDFPWLLLLVITRW